MRLHNPSHHDNRRSSHDWCVVGVVIICSKIFRNIYFKRRFHLAVVRRCHAGSAFCAILLLLQSAVASSHADLLPLPTLRQFTRYISAETPQLQRMLCGTSLTVLLQRTYYALPTYKNHSDNCHNS